MRNLNVFFRDKTSVFFSLLGVLIIIGLYVLFLGDLVISDLGEIKGARFLIDSWIMAGVLAVSSITAALGAFGTMVDDKAKKVIKDFNASPLSRRSLTAGYIASSFVIGVILTLVALVFAELYIVAYGGRLLDLPAALRLIGVILLSVLSSSSMVCLLVSFLSSMNAFGTASTIIGTLIGFLTGTYIPIGIFPDPIQTVIRLFPVSHSGVLFRQLMMDVPLRESFAGAPSSAANAFREEMGVVFTYGGNVFPWWGSVLVLAATALVFYSLALFRLTRKSR
ncbi:ABC transporter permease [Syntrophobotulus glycolicus]|uniref:ABC transporter permease n=1 Tax=Syntrophobotulus glycolicus TaxID=51197 RepID=UPI001FA7E88A|nr:ABC transporter permease [Syntrophobotulus glycolicus]